MNRCSDHVATASVKAATDARIAVYGDTRIESETFLKNRNEGEAGISMPPRSVSARDVSQRFASVSCDSVRSNLLPITRLRFDSKRLYGRQAEMSQLREAYNRVRRTSRRGEETSGEQCCNKEIGAKKDGNDSAGKNDAENIGKGAPAKVADKALLITEEQQQSSSVEMVLISGYSGTGKSALAQQLKRIVHRTGGLVASGKFDLQQRMEPYSAFITAFNELCDSVLSLGRSNPSSFVKIQNDVEEAVGSEGKTLVDLIPNFHHIIGENKYRGVDPDSVSHAEILGAGYVDAKNRFNFVMRKFVKAVSTPSHPLVLFLDDLQWADAASLDLLETLVTDRSSGSFLFVGCYRENEIEGMTHPLAVRLRELERQSVSMTRVSVGNLSVEAVNEIISDVLSSSTSSTQKLAEIVHRKTLGNVFFVIQFLNSLCDEKLLWFCLATFKWRWDEGKIQSETYVTDNVVDLMRRKVQKLSVGTREMLQVATCLGSTFTASMLMLVVETLQQEKNSLQRESTEKQAFDGQQEQITDKQLSHHLDLCVREGLLETDATERDGSVVYRFAHDQIQLAVYSLIPEQERKSLQFRIGEILVDKSSPEQLEKNLFIAVELLCKGANELRGDDAKRMSLAKLSLRAGKKAMESAAFIPAAMYLKTGISMLCLTHWETDYQLCLDLYCTAAEAEYCNGNFEQMNEFLEEVFASGGAFENKLRAYITLIDSLGAQEMLPEAIGASFRVLACLGVKFPKDTSKFVIVAELLRTKFLLKSRSIDDLTELPLMEAGAKTTAMRLLDTLSIVGYFVQPSLVPMSIFRMVRLSLQHGVCKYSAAAFAGYGVILSSALGDYQGGHEFGKLALTLSRRFDAKDIQARLCSIIHSFIDHWVAPIQLSLKAFLHGYQVGMEAGDIKNALFNLAIRSGCSTCAGRSLPSIEKEIRAYSQKIQEHRQDIVYLRILPTWQYVLNLMGLSKNPVVMTGEVMDLDEMLKSLSGPTRYCIKKYQMQLAYYFGHYEMAWDIASQIKVIEKCFMSHFFMCRCVCVASLVSFALARKTKRRRYRCLAVKTMKKVKKWARNRNMNRTHIVHLLEAEHAALKGREDAARKEYDLAISTAGRCGALHDKALANERAGIFFAELGDKYWASYCLNLAHELYVDWGAVSKANQLRAQYGSTFIQSDVVPASSRAVQ